MQDRLRELDGSDERFDSQLWAELARAGVLAAALPAEVGGDGWACSNSALC
jgi:alkylation response protein AidB-like acyl-CoA dehydrogenase